jgi:hypothetical protein
MRGQETGWPSGAQRAAAPRSVLTYRRMCARRWLALARGAASRRNLPVDRAPFTAAPLAACRPPRRCGPPLAAAARPGVLMHAGAPPRRSPAPPPSDPQTEDYTFDPFPDLPADFGPEIPEEGVDGLLLVRAGQRRGARDDPRWAQRARRKQGCRLLVLQQQPRSRSGSGGGGDGGDGSCRSNGPCIRETAGAGAP